MSVTCPVTTAWAPLPRDYQYRSGRDHDGEADLRVTGERADYAEDDQGEADKAYMPILLGHLIRLTVATSLILRFG